MGSSKKALFIARLSILIAFTLVMQAAALPQPITGPLINAMLFFTESFLGMMAGVILGSVTPVVALLMGQLPAPLAPMVPFIILSNAALVVIFTLMKKINYRLNSLNQARIYIAIVAAALVKTLLLFTAIRFLLPILFGRTMKDELVLMMTTPQFVTAVVGGIIALFLLQLLKRSQIIKS